MKKNFLVGFIGGTVLGLGFGTYWFFVKVLKADFWGAT